jgi:hypothetical protein
MTREEPVVPFEVLDTILIFAAFSLVKLFDDFCARCLGVDVVGIDIFDEDSERLRVATQFCGTFAARPFVGNHDPRVAEVQLGSRDRIAVTEVLFEAEGSAEPGDRFIEVW